MALNTEMLSRQIARLHAESLQKLNDSCNDFPIQTDRTLFHVGYLAAIDKVLVMVNTLPEDATGRREINKTVIER